MNFFLLIFLPTLLFADIQKCVDEYNSAIVERNKGLGVFRLAQVQKTKADGKISAAERKTYIQEALISAISAIDILEKSEGILKIVQQDCVQSIIDKASEISSKNKQDLSEILSFKKDMDLTLELPR